MAYPSAGFRTARSPVWNRGCMLVPCVERYVVVPPSPEGQNNQTVVSTSAARALVLTTLGTAVMARAPIEVGRGGRLAAPPRPELLVRGDREAGLVERREGH